MKPVRIFLIILISVFLGTALNAQTVYIKHEDNWVLNGGQFVTSDGTNSDWAVDMATKYIADNPHLSSYQADEFYDFIVEKFDSLDGYYHTTFGERTTADWFFIMKAKYTGAGVWTFKQPVITKSGDALRWLFTYSDGTDSIHLADNPPDKIYDDSLYILVSTTDTWDGMTIFNLNAQYYMEGSPPLFKDDNLLRYQILSGHFDGTLPNFDFGNANMDFVWLGGNDFDSVTSIVGLLSPGLVNFWFHNSGNYLADFRQEDIDLMLNEMAYYYKHNTPTGNLDIRFNGTYMSAPSGDTMNYHLDIARQTFDSAGFELTYNVEEVGTTTLDQLPYLTMPDTMYITTDTTYMIYDWNVASRSMSEGGLNIVYDCDIGTRWIYGLHFDEDEADTGYHDLTIYAQAGYDYIDTVESVIYLFKPKVVGTYTLNGIGNSLMAGGAMINYIDEMINSNTITTVGEVNSSDQYHEGRAGYRIYDFISGYRLSIGQRNPMWNGSAYDYPAYRADTLGLGSPIDFVLIQLGINSITGNNIDTAYIEDTWLGYLQTLVDGILSDGTTHVLIGMESKCENTGNGWYYNYQDTRNQSYYIAKMQYIWYRTNEVYSGSRYSSRVHVLPQGLFIDSDNNYPVDANGTHNNGVHPTDEGHHQLAGPAKALIEGLIKKDAGL